MIYPLELTVPGNTPEIACVSRRDWLPPGKIIRMAWVMPTGCNDMVKARLLMNETQIMPILADTWLKGNGIMGPFDEDITVPPGGTQMQLVACSPNTTYPHTITVYIDLVQVGATLEDLIDAVNRMGALPAVTEAEIQSEGESVKSNVFLEG